MESSPEPLARPVEVASAVAEESAEAVPMLAPSVTPTSTVVLPAWALAIASALCGSAPTLSAPVL